MRFLVGMGIGGVLGAESVKWELSKPSIKKGTSCEGHEWVGCDNLE